VGATTAFTAREEFVTALYAALDAAIAVELQRLSERGVVPSCRSGCSTCCAQHIVTNRLEVHAIGQYVRRRFTPERIEALRMRACDWNRWEEAGRDGSVQPATVDRRCPLLEGTTTCGIYPVRPLICRAHFVSSDPAWCRPALTPDARAGVAHVLESVREVGAPFKRRMSDQDARTTGLPPEETVTLLPPGLAEEMGWE